MEGRLPDFFLVGAAKAGSTTIADWLRAPTAGEIAVSVSNPHREFHPVWLRAHPEVCFSSEKEPYFFNRDDNYARGLDWYLRLFDRAEAARATVVGEGTPTTMLYAQALERIAALVPQARLIAILRDPADRAYANYRHTYYRQVIEHRPFERLVRDELRDGPRLPRRDRAEFGDLRYLASGLYMDQIELILEHFPRKQLHVLLLDDVKRDGPGEFARICRFLGIDDSTAGEIAVSVSNPHREFHPVWLWRAIVRTRVLRPFPARVGMSVAARMRTEVKAPPMDPEVRRVLDDFFAEPNARLGAWLGRELPWGR